MRLRLENFIDLLKKYRTKVNLTGARSREEISKLTEDSLIPLEKGLRVLDIGSGGGIPGLPLKIMNPGIRITFMDKNRKKMNILRLMLGVLDIDFEDICIGQAVEFHKDLRHRFDVVVSRGVGESSFVFSLARPFLTDGGVLYLWKPKGYDPATDLEKMPGIRDTEIIPAKYCDIAVFYLM